KHSFIIVADGKDAGLLRLDPYESDGESEKGAHEVHILVAPTMQGKGIGLAAIATAKQEAKKLGMKKLVARVKEGNKASQAIFQKNGFSGGPALFECKI
ncbi:MAG: GNAT family N-acetyltransferase, partial [Candidatus Micrarchaeota archaeon]|nr:GNAT family N-acetyltransferase [Candidatus Micrarchaeota archaeon]